MSKRKLLLADDSVTIQKVINLTFADEGIEVVTTGDGDSAMEKLREIKPDLVMADVNMPGLSGYQICEQIKKDQETKETPVILLVGSFEPFDEEKARAVGADAYLTKPFQSIRQLVAKVTELLGEKETAQTVDGDPFARTLEIETEPANERQFEDASADDEMIQTSPADSFEKIKEPVEETEIEDDIGKTQPLSREDIKEFSFTGTQQEQRDIPQEPEEIPQPEAGFSEEEKGYYPAEQEETGEDKAIYYAEEQSEDPYQAGEAYQSEAAAEPAQETDSYTAASQEDTEEYDMEKEDSNLEELPQPSAASVLELDEMNLLDLPPIEESVTKAEESKEIELEPLSQETEEIPPAKEEKVKTAVASQLSAQDFPPEVIEAIAEKVFEKLSNKLKE